MDLGIGVTRVASTEWEITMIVLYYWKCAPGREEYAINRSHHGIIESNTYKKIIVQKELTLHWQNFFVKDFRKLTSMYSTSSPRCSSVLVCVSIGSLGELLILWGLSKGVTALMIDSGRWMGLAAALGLSACGGVKYPEDSDPDDCLWMLRIDDGVSWEDLRKRI